MKFKSLSVYCKNCDLRKQDFNISLSDLLNRILSHEVVCSKCKKEVVLQKEISIGWKTINEIAEFREVLSILREKQQRIIKLNLENGEIEV